MTTISDAARAMGRAGRGASKVRGDADHYRRIRAMRPEPQVYESDGEWAGWSVREGLKGWIVETWSAVSGERTGARYLVPYTSRLPRTMQLDDPANDSGTLNAEIIAEERQAGRILRRGHIVR